jgi:hypothetical protein
MPAPERGGPPGRPEEPQHREFEPAPYHRVARFPDAHSAGQVYAQAQDAIFQGPPSDISVYRFLLDQVSHVAVLGEPPPPALDEALTAILAAGEPSNLPHGVLIALSERRRTMRRHGPWVEGHYHPGQPL